MVYTRKSLELLRKIWLDQKGDPWNGFINGTNESTCGAARRHLIEEEAEHRILEDYAGEVTGGNARYRGETAFEHFKRLIGTYYW